MQATSPIEVEMQVILANLQCHTPVHPQSLEELFKTQVRHNAVQHRTLKGFVVCSARDIIKNLLPELKSNSKFQEALNAELKQFSKVKIEEFIRMLEKQVEQSEFELDDEDGDWAIIPGSDNKTFTEQLREYILSSTHIPDPLNQQSSTLGKIGGAIGTGFYYAGWTVYQILRVSYFGLQLSIGVAPLIPIALLLIKSRAAFI